MAGSSADDGVNAVAVDSSSGAVYVAGFASESVDGQTYVSDTVAANYGDFLVSDMILIKYASNGTRVWTKMAGSSGGGGDMGTALAIDSSGDVFMAGFAGGALHGQTAFGLWDVALIK
ncbi:hypothetical protein EON64_10290, partial [archaeon]